MVPFDITWFIRIGMVAIFLYHGLTKTIRGFADAFNLPVWVSIAVIFAEIAAGIGYLWGGYNTSRYFGLTLTQLSSLAIIPVILGAIALVHWKNGFNVMEGGWEFQFLILMVAMYLLLSP